MNYSSAHCILWAFYNLQDSKQNMQVSVLKEFKNES
jgi:hypothetical protein